MKTTISKGIGLALCLSGSVLPLRAQTAQQIEQMRTFREGLAWVGDREPSQSENQELSFRILNHLQEPEWTTDLEQFLKDHPDSPWAASLHYDYASFCRRTGRTTKALEQFEAAWNCVKDDASPAGRRLSGAILGNWTDLLSSLGRLEELKKLVAIGDHWQFVNPGDRDKFQGAKHSYLLMQEHPEIAFRCGTFALKAVGESLQPTNQALESLVEVPSPTNGFSMAGLLELAKKYGLNLVAVRRKAGDDLIVPSVVHWRQNHYAAILGRQDEFYRVSDPTFGRDQWLPAEVINEEASGEFLVPAGAEPKDWPQLALNDAKAIHGMGLPNDIKDGKDKGCKPGGPCPPCNGMPVWWVSEPYINLWMADEPLSYVTSRGDRVALRLTYKERDSRPTPSDYLVDNAGWNNSWSGYIHVVSDFPCAGPVPADCVPALSSSYSTVYLPNGGEVDFSPGQTYDQETGVMLREMFPPNGLQYGGDDGSHGLEIIHADGSQDVYGTVIIVPEVPPDASEAECLLSRHISPNGDTTYFEYGGVNSAYAVMFMVDPDGRTNTLSYTSQNLLSSVTNAYGQSAHFAYDSHGNLTNIVDAQGLSSSITYDASNNPSALITPYGTNTFDIYQNSTVASTNDLEGNFGGDSSPYIDRAILATDPVGANYLYLFQYDCSPFMSTTYSSSDVPTNTPLGTLDNGSGSGTNSLAAVCYRNSFYWGPRQYPNLSTTNMFSFTANDYMRGRMQHWLEDTNQLYLTEFLSTKQDPTPDGSTAGLLTFYDYQGKLPGYNFCEGTNALPSVTAWRLPSGETHYEYSLLDVFGKITNDITTYTLANGSVGTRTNQFVYANNTNTYTIGTWTGSNIINTVSYSYVVPDLLTQVIGPDGNTIWAYGGFDSVTWTNIFGGVGYNATTLISSRVAPDYATNGLGQVATSTYTSTGMPVNFYDLNPGDYSYGAVLVSTFSGYGKVTGVTSVSGLTTTNIYNTNGFLSRTIDLQIGRTNSFGYTTDGLIGAFTNELGLNVSGTWDNLLRLTSVQYPDGTYASNTFTRLDLTARRDRLGNVTAYGYDGARHLISITNANNAVWQFDWCGCGALTGITDPLTNFTSLNYDNQANLTNVAFPDGSALNYQYDLAARPTSVSDGAGRALQLRYNNQNLVTTVSNTLGQVQGIVCDIRDRQAVVIDANKISITNGFDLLDRIVSRTWPDGIAERYAYLPQGLAFYTNRDTEVTQLGRDVAGRLIAVTNANDEVVRAAYDPFGDITNLVNGLTNTTSWQYNQFGWLTNKVDGLGRNAFRYAYNANGWVTNRFTPEKGNTGYSYDNVGNLTSIIYPQSTINYAYDALNRRTNMTDAVGTTAFSYTPVGQLASETGPWANDSVTYTYSQQLRTALTLTQPGGSWSQSYGYDSMWRMTSLVSPAGTFAYRYNFQPASALVSQIILPNDANITNSYDAMARLTGTALNNYWGHTLDGSGYQDDPLGLCTNITRNFGLTNSSVSIGYDLIGQLNSWSAKEPSGMARLNEQLSFGYDAAHNLHSRTNEALVQTFSADAADQLTNVTRTGAFTVSGATPAPATNVTVNGQAAQTYSDFTFAGTNNTLANGTNTFTIVVQNKYGVSVTNTVTANLPSSVVLNYDNNGNLTNDGSRTFGYDAENQLTNIMVTGQWRSDFIYDGLNRRRIARDYSWNGSTWIETNVVHYVCDGYIVIQERDTNNNVLVTYTRASDLSGDLWNGGGIGGLLARTDGDGSSFYHADGNGNVTTLIDNKQNIVARYEYDPYGNTLAMSGIEAIANRYRFSSKEIHPNSGLYYYGFRYYQPNLQRWPNRDPIGERGGLNLYAYVANDPVNLFDPFGLRPPTGTQGGYVDQFGNWHMSFCMSCHDNTPAGNFLMSQSMAANNQSWGVFAYQQGLGLGLGLGLGGIANDMSLDAMMEAEQASQLAQMGKGIVCNGKVVAHAPLEAVTSHEQLAMQSGTLLQAPQAGTTGSLVPGAEAFTYSAQGPNVFVTGSMNFNSNVSENTVQVVTFYLNRK